METSSICGLKMKSVPPPHECVVDSFASELKQGERAHAAGLVLVVGWSWGSDPSTMYESMAADMRKIDPVSLHVYEAQYLHCTIATLSRQVMYVKRLHVTSLFQFKFDIA